MMLLSRVIQKTSGRYLRSPLGLRPFRVRKTVQRFQTLRWNSTSTQTTPNQAGKKPILPECLLVFHAGTGRSVFLGCLKVTTIFIFGFFGLVLAPAHFQSEDQPKWVAAGVMLSGIVPVAFVAYITSPFVANIHLRLPAFARYSREMVTRYSQALPKDAKLEITTVNFIGMPRVTLVKVADLRPAKERLGLVNYVRDTKDMNTKRPWWMGRAVRQFGIHGGVRIPQRKDVWENIAKAIEKRSV